MAQPGTQGPRKHENQISLRLDDELQQRIEAFARQNDISKSTAMRVLLSRALGEPQHVTSARECIASFSAMRKQFVARMISQLEAAIPDSLARAAAAAAEDA